jgi:hypothetical protein
VEDSLATFKTFVESAGTVMKTEKCMYMCTDEGDGLLEFHCMNAGTGKDLVEGLNQLLEYAAKHYTKAVTFYDNDKVNVLAKHAHFKTEISKIDGGTDKTYRMYLNLQEKVNGMG